MFDCIYIIDEEAEEELSKPEPMWPKENPFIKRSDANERAKN